MKSASGRNLIDALAKEAQTLVSNSSVELVMKFFICWTFGGES